MRTKKSRKRKTWKSQRHTFFTLPLGGKRGEGIVCVKRNINTRPQIFDAPEFEIHQVFSSRIPVRGMEKRVMDCGPGDL